MRQSPISFILALVAALCCAQPLSAVEDVRISQVYGGGGNSGATLTNDFIELYNNGAAVVSLTGWSVQYASAAGTSWSVTALSGSIASGGYYLIQEAPGAGGTHALPTPDKVGTIAMGSTAGKVSLLSTTMVLSGASPVGNSNLVDLVGYGSTANASEGSPTSTPNNTTAALRKSAGAVDTDSNSADFTLGTPNPRNAAFGGPLPTSPSGAGLAAPANVLPGAATLLSVLVTPGANPASTGLSVTVDLSALGGAASQAFFDDASNGDSSAGDLRFSFAITVPATTLPGTKALPATISDTQGRSTSTSVALTVIDTTPGPLRIHDIQGASHRSPVEGQTISKVPGIVTSKRGNGFYLQDPTPDGDPATSEAIFVFTSSVPTVSIGDALLVSAKVSEFRPGGAASANLTTTELLSPLTTFILSSGNPLPGAELIGPGGRVAPTMVITAGDPGNVELPGVTFDPLVNGLDFYESLEGMRVKIVDAVAVGPTSSFGEIPVLAANGVGAGVRTARGGILLRPGDANPERIFLDDVFMAMPLLSVGDRFDGEIMGVLDYSFGNFKLAPSTLPPVITGGLTRETTTLTSGPGELTVATYNVENLDPSDLTFADHADIIVNRMRAPDLICVEEIQDDNGATNDGVVLSTATAGKLINAILDAGGPVYAYRDIAPLDGQDGGQPGGNIRVAFLFNPDRLTFVDRAGGTATTATTVLPGPELSASPGRVDPLNSAFTTSRKPLAGEFLFGNRTLFVIANHFNSKGGDQPLSGRFQPPVRSSEIQRHQQAQIVHDFVAAIVAQDAAASVVVLGDLNDFDTSQTLTILKGDLLHNLADDLADEERYDYVFEGNSQTLDHILVSNPLAAAGAQVDIVHVNSEFFDQTSDHEPIVARLVINRAPTVEIGADAVITTGSTFTRVGTITDLDFGEIWTATADFGDGSGMQALDVVSTGFTLNHAYLFQGSFTVSVAVTDSQGATATTSLVVTTTGGLVRPWVRSDLGAVLRPGFSRSVDDSFVLAGLGRGFIGLHDEADLVAQSITGNVVLTAHLDALIALHPQAFAGISLRASLADDARHVSVGLTGNRRVRVLSRVLDHGPTQPLSNRPFHQSPPLWLRLTRSSDVVTAWTSGDGQIWSVEVALEVALGTHIEVGLVTAGGSAFLPAGAVFSSVVVLPTAAQ